MSGAAQSIRSLSENILWPKGILTKRALSDRVHAFFLQVINPSFRKIERITPDADRQETPVHFQDVTVCLLIRFHPFKWPIVPCWSNLKRFELKFYATLGFTYQGRSIMIYPNFVPSWKSSSLFDPTYWVITEYSKSEGWWRRDGWPE